MSAEPYIPEKYISESNAYDSLGISIDAQKNLTQAEKKRFQDWVRNANTNVEISLFPDAEAIPLVEGDAIFTYARAAALHWVEYERRNYTGSANAKESKQKFEEDIQKCKELLKRTPTSRNTPIQAAEVTDSVGDNYKIPYSQTQGYPPNILY